MAPLKPPRPPHAKVKTPPPSHAQQEAQAAAEEAKIHEHMESADEDLASMVYTQASEVVIQNLGKVLEAINKREHRNYPVIKFSTDIERVLKEKAEEMARRDGMKPGVWFLKPYCEMGRCMINRLRYDRSLKLIEVTDACDAKLVVAKLAGEAAKKKAAAAAAAATTADAKKRKRQEQLIKKGVKPTGRMGGPAGSSGGSDISPTSVTNLDGGAKKRKRPRPGSQGEAGAGSDDDAPVTDLLSSKRKLKVKGGGAPPTEHRKSVSSVASAGEGTVNSAATAASAGGGGNRIIIKKSSPSSSTKFKIPIKPKGSAGNGATTVGPSSASSDGDSNDALRLREKAKEEKLKKAQELVNEKRRREAEEEVRQREVQEKKLLFIKNQKEHLKKQEEHRQRKAEEERRKREKEKREKEARRKRAREERESMKRTIDFDADQRALDELQQQYNLNPFGTNMTRQVDWEVGEGEVEPYQGENNYYRPPMIRA